MGLISVSLPADGSTADVSDYNVPITTIVTLVNGQLDNANIASLAAIDGSKLADTSVSGTKIVNATITNAKLSTTAAEIGGAWTSFTPTFTGFSVAPAATGTRWIQIGKLIVVSYSCLGGTSNTTALTASLPIVASTNALGSYVRDFPARAQDNGAIGANPGLIEFDIGATTFSVFKDFAGTGWTNTGTKGFRAVIMYETV